MSKAFTTEQRQKRVSASRLWRLNNPERFKHSQKNATLRKKYGMGLEEYEALLEEQGGVCAICETDRNYSSEVRPGSESGWYFAVDHDHVTGKVRGLLCNRCNGALGHFRDNPALLRRALAYLVKHMEGGPA